MKIKVIAIATNLALVLTLLPLYTQFAFARLVLTFWGIQSVNNTGYIVCNPNCHLSSNSYTGDSAVEAAYRLVCVNSETFSHDNCRTYALMKAIDNVLHQVNSELSNKK